ncbi:unnamed protein product [Cylindrotheca closterium]|uniref:Phytanoyl-CoA dioxygenase n=1 Tax=Cylindrotheca closterium TaxID=2856 RepID=A0AAD2FN16_9STRA|nr:unnamed protein product [Cylindrotheca closterium]
MWQTAIIVAAAVILEVVQLHQSKAQSQDAIRFRGGAKHPKTPPLPSVTITPTELTEYHRDGFVLKKGLLQGEELSKLMDSAEEIYATANHQKDANLPNFFKKLTFDLWRRKDEFAQLAFENLPSVAAEFLGVGDAYEMINNEDNNNNAHEKEETIRILKDGFFGFQQKNNTGCGFHVDDKIFWPASYETTGVNFWIALSPMRIQEGGGIRVVNQSKVEPIFEECRQAITNVGERGYSPTCDMEEVSPECHEKMLEASVVFDMEPGDALIWDRWTFHRSEPFRPVPEGERSEEHQCDDPSAGADGDDYRLRYTIRYVPGKAKAWGRHHPSQVTGETFDSPYYPQVWPSVLKSEMKSIQKGLED